LLQVSVRQQKIISPNVLYLLENVFRNISCASLPLILKVLHIGVAHLSCMRGNSEGVIEPLAIMARRACTFKQRDVTRALRAASAAGLHVCRVEFDANGNFGLVTGPSSDSSSNDDLNRELEEFVRRNGKN
jgi:hypothetical protein